MVLESLYSPEAIEKRPIDMLILSFVVALASIFLSNYLVPEFAGWTIPLLVAVAMAPVFYRIFKFEEELDREEAEERIKASFLQRHGETIIIFSLFFLGNFAAVFLVSLLMPTGFVESTFSQQIDAIRSITTLVANVISSQSVSGNALDVISLNNLRVMLLAFVLSFLLGTGALIILSWNASVLAIYFALLLRDGLFVDFLSKTAGIIPHAPIEFLAYFLAGIAGGILSVGVIREKIGSKEFNLVLKDSMIMMAVAVASIVLGAYVEVYL